MSEGGKALLEFLGITGDVDLSTSEKRASWVLHVSERLGLVLAQQICDQYPTAQAYGSAKGDLAVMNFYTRHYYVAIACELLAKRSHDELCRNALAHITMSIRLEREQRARDIQPDLAEFHLNSESNFARELSESIRAKVGAQNAADFSVFDGASMWAQPADTPHFRLARALVEIFYAPPQHQEVAEAVFTMALRSSIFYMKLALGA